MLKEYQFDSWEEFKYLYHERLGSKNSYLFRGQGDSTWKLISAFDRTYSKLDYDKLINYFWKEFQDPLTVTRFPDQKYFIDEIRSAPFYQEGKNISNVPIEFIALGQHYGLPTRLLDWTESPYIAAFFAFSEAIPLLSNSTLKEIKSDQREIAIWVLENSSHWEDKGLKIHIPKKDGNLRLFQQKGYFTEFIKEKWSQSSMEELIKREDTPLTIKFCIPVNQSTAAIRDLNLMGIDSTSVFGDLTGRAKAALNKAIIENLESTNYN